MPLLPIKRSIVLADSLTLRHSPFCCTILASLCRWLLSDIKSKCKMNSWSSNCWIMLHCMKAPCSNSCLLQVLLGHPVGLFVGVLSLAPCILEKLLLAAPASSPVTLCARLSCRWGGRKRWVINVSTKLAEGLGILARQGPPRFPSALLHLLYATSFISQNRRHVLSTWLLADRKSRFDHLSTPYRFFSVTTGTTSWLSFHVHLLTLSLSSACRHEKI